MSELPDLSRREREIMDVIYARSTATVREVIDGLEEPPGESAMRTMLSRLEQKGHLRREQQGPRNVYLATAPRSRVRKTAVSRLLKTFFDGSVEQAVSALLSNPRKLDREQLDRIAAFVEQKRKEAE